jgi:hypothetical protein
MPIETGTKALPPSRVSGGRTSTFELHHGVPEVIRGPRAVGVYIDFDRKGQGSTRREHSSTCSRHCGLPAIGALCLLDSNHRTELRSGRHAELGRHSLLHVMVRDTPQTWGRSSHHAELPQYGKITRLTAPWSAGMAAVLSTTQSTRSSGH